MSWVAKKPFYHRGKLYSVGDDVPTEAGPTRNALIKLKRIAHVPGEDEVPQGPPPVDIYALNRDELNEYALQQGIEKPKAYSKKDDLIKALEEKAEESAEPPAAPVDNPPVEPEEEEDLFPSDTTSESGDDLFGELGESGEVIAPEEPTE